MAHSGSVGLGHTVGSYFLDRARAIFPRELKHPEHGFYVVPTEGPHAALAAKYLDAMHNAANFAFANRLFLGLMTIRVLSEVLGRPVESRLIPPDAPWPLQRCVLVSALGSLLLIAIAMPAAIRVFRRRTMQ